MIAKEFIIKDIMDYMIDNDVDPIIELEHYSYDTILDLIMLGCKCSFNDAYDIYVNSIYKNGYDKTYEYIAYDLIGSRPSEDNKNNVDKNKLTYLEILEKFFNELQTVDNNFTLSEYLNMNTRFMYKYAEGIKHRYINTLNNKNEEQFRNATTFLGILFGKIKKPLKINEAETNNNDTLKNKLLALKNGGVYNHG